MTATTTTTADPFAAEFTGQPVAFITGPFFGGEMTPIVHRLGGLSDDGVSYWPACKNAHAAWDAEHVRPASPGEQACSACWPYGACFWRNTRTDTPAYRADYERGWRYSARPTATLDHLDAKGASEAEYDGYMDRAVGRPKWHHLTCPWLEHETAPCDY